MDRERVLELFRKMGLSRSDARTYLTLLSSGPLTAAKLAEEMGVNRAKVYASLNRLFSKGLVEVSKGKPALYKAVSPKIVVETFRGEMDKLGEEALNYLTHIERKGRVSHNIWILRSRMGLYRRIRYAIREAEKDLIVCGSITFIKRLLDELLDAQDRGVMVYSMIYEPPGYNIKVETLRALEGLNKLKITLTGEHLVVRDSSLAVISYKKWRTLKESSYGLVVEEPLFINYILTDFFRGWYWARVVQDKPIKLPARLTVHKLALLEADQLMRCGVKLAGEFEGWWVQTGEKGRVKGEIIDVYMDLRSGLMYFGVKSGDRYIRVGGPDAIIEEFAMKEAVLRECS